MKQTFKEYYRIEGEVAKQIWENGIIVGRVDSKSSNFAKSGVVIVVYEA